MSKLLKCEHCDEYFTPERNYHPYRYCSVTCRNRAIAIANTLPFEIRFWRMVARQGQDECWEWLGSRAKDYALYRGRQAHRVAYELLVGTIPKGKVLDHLCRNHYCLNPGHLEPVTHRVNILRGVAPAARNARMETCKHGHAFTLEASGKRRCRTCAYALRKAKRAQAIS